MRHDHARATDASQKQVQPRSSVHRGPFSGVPWGSRQNERREHDTSNSAQQPEWGRRIVRSPVEPGREEGPSPAGTLHPLGPARGPGDGPGAAVANLGTPSWDQRLHSSERQPIVLDFFEHELEKNEQVETRERLDSAPYYLNRSGHNQEPGVQRISEDTLSSSPWLARDGGQRHDQGLRDGGP